jgi:hypothetical protein
MLENDQGNPLPAICTPDHWRMLELMMQNPALFSVLRTAVNQRVDSVVAGHQQGQQTAIDSTADGPHILSSLPGCWQADYNQWHTAIRQLQRNLPPVEPGQMYGMMLWYVLATDRQETWRVSKTQVSKVYELMA